jgi:uncharacterized protein (TIGR02646 family)
VIQIHRKPEELDGLAAARDRALEPWRNLATPPASLPRDELSDSYNRFRPGLCEMQHHKCCYCERIEMPVHNDVEHFRPVSIYPWLGWTWVNLFFACRACNQQGGKAAEFPLVDEVARLEWWEDPPGAEQPLLVDPCLDDPREHIEFVYLVDRSRFVPQGKTERGRKTVGIVGLDRDDYVERFELFIDHHVRPKIQHLRAWIVDEDRPGVIRTWNDCLALLGVTREFRALSEDALRYFVTTYPNPPATLEDLRTV